MRFLIMLEQTEAGFAVQVPDLAISTFGTDVESAKRAAQDAIQINLNAYREAGRTPPEPEPVSHHLENTDFKDLLFAYVDLPGPYRKIAA